MKKLTLTVMVFMMVLGTAFAQQVYTTQGNSLGALTEEDLDLGIQLLVDNDLVALQSLIDAGRVFPLKKGLQVYLVDLIWLGKVKVRLKGTTTVFYTVMEEIK